MTKAHVLARAVDVIPDIVYYWRERAQGRLSITQSRTSVANLRDRMTAMNDIDQFIAAHSTASPAPGAPAQGPEERPVALRPGPAQGDRRLPGRVRRPGERLPGPRRPPGAAQPARPPQAGLSPGADPGHAAARRAGRLDGRAAGAPGARGQAAGQAPGRPAVPDDSPVPIPSRVFRPHWRDLDPYMQVDDIDWEPGPAGGDRPGQRAVRRHPPAPEHLQDRGPAPARPPAPGGAARPVVPQPGGHGAVRAGQVQLRLVGFPVRGQPPAVPRHRGVAVLHARPRATASGARPGCTPRYPAPRSGRGPARWRPACGSAPAGPVSA